MKVDSIRFFFCILIPICMLSSCNRMDSSNSQEALSVSTVNMNLTIERYGTRSTKGETQDSWAEWSRIFILLSNGNRTMPVEAWLENGVWGVQCFNTSGDGWWGTSVPDFADFSSGTCVCYYFEGDDGANGQRFSRSGDGVNGLIRVDEYTAVYCDKEAIFNVVDGVISFSIHLKPLNGRIRFTHDFPNWNYQVFGVSRFNALNVNTGEISTTNKAFQCYTNESSVTDYIYGFLPDKNNSVITVERDGVRYKRKFSSDVLSPGTGSVCKFPTVDSHNEWTMSGNVEDGNRLFDGVGTLIHIVSGTFDMGGNDAQPIHSVTLTKDFFISRSEVSQSLWYSVMGSPAEYQNGSDPVYGKNWDEVQGFISELNKQSGFSFRLPTEAEWEFSARGGLRSEGYTHSGNVQGVFGWGPYSSGYYGSNELGLNDMSGNVSEWVSDWYAPYSEAAVTDPTGPASGDIHVRRGGDCYSGEQYLTVTYRDIDSPLTYTGFRLAADIPSIH